MKLYSELADWWPLLTPPGTYTEEAQVLNALLRQGNRDLRHIIEFGSGGGHLAADFPKDLQITLVDNSPEMLEVSRQINPEKEHILGDMRDLHSNRQYDAVLVHDAVMYLQTREDIFSMLSTAYRQLTPGGCILLVPDYIKESFAENSISGGAADERRAIQLMEWAWDPIPDDEKYQVEFSILTRQNNTIQSFHETHYMGLFDISTWVNLLNKSGFTLVVPEIEYWFGGEIFLARKT